MRRLHVSLYLTMTPTPFITILPGVRTRTWCKFCKRTGPFRPLGPARLRLWSSPMLHLASSLWCPDPIWTPASSGALGWSGPVSGWSPRPRQAPIVFGMPWLYPRKPQGCKFFHPRRVFSQRRFAYPRRSIYCWSLGWLRCGFVRRICLDLSLEIC